MATNKQFRFKVTSPLIPFLQRYETLFNPSVQAQVKDENLYSDLSLIFIQYFHIDVSACLKPKLLKGRSTLGTFGLRQAERSKKTFM